MAPGASAGEITTGCWAQRPRQVIEFDDVQDLVSPVVIAAFEGWNDAADAASGLVDHLIEQWKAEVIGAIDP